MQPYKYRITRYENSTTCKIRWLHSFNTGFQLVLTSLDNTGVFLLQQLECDFFSDFISYTHEKQALFYLKPHAALIIPSHPLNYCFISDSGHLCLSLSLSLLLSGFVNLCEKNKDNKYPRVLCEKQNLRTCSSTQLSKMFFRLIESQ